MNPLRSIAFLITVAIAFAACRKNRIPDDVDFRAEMRTFVQEIAASARQTDADFIVIPQNGQELLSSSATSAGPPAVSYLAAIDGIGREDLYYGYSRDNEATPASETSYMRGYLDLARSNGLTVLVTDYCSSISKMDDSYNKNAAAGYVSLSADRRELDRVPAHPPQPFNVSSDTILRLSQIRNFLYLINPGNFPSRQAFVAAVSATNYDLVIIDLFFNDGSEFSPWEIEAMRSKANGGRRLVIAYMSIGEAEDYRYYWKSDWRRGNPKWIYKENPDWKGNYKVFYWDSEWKAIIFGTPDSYLAKILGAGFDGVYLDIIDAYEYFEEN